MRALFFLLGFTGLIATSLQAQQFSGEGTCGPPEDPKIVPVGDHPGHFYSLTTNNCTWTKPAVIAGVRTQGGTTAQIDERDGNTSRFRGHYVERMESGDTVHFRYQGAAMFQGETPQRVSWNWNIVGGSGKFKNLTGRGSCKGSWPGGKNRWSCSGTYRLPS